MRQVVERRSSYSREVDAMDLFERHRALRGFPNIPLDHAFFPIFLAMILRGGRDSDLDEVDVLTPEAKRLRDQVEDLIKAEAIAGGLRDVEVAWPDDPPRDRVFILTAWGWS